MEKSKNKIINDEYLNKENIASIRKHLKANGIVMLNEFLDVSEFRKLKEVNRKLKFKKYYDPTICNYSIFYKKTSNFKAIKKYIELICGKKLNDNCQIIKAKKGNYTLIEDGQKQSKSYEAIFDFTKNWAKTYGGLVNYRFFDKDEVVQIPSSENSLVIINANKSKKYIKKINHTAKGERLFVSFY